MYRNQASRPDYRDEAPGVPYPWQRRPSPILGLDPEAAKVVGLIAIIAVAFVGLCWDAYVHPCVRFGPEKTSWQWVSCGDNCMTMVPQTYRECMERVHR